MRWDLERDARGGLSVGAAALVGDLLAPAAVADPYPLLAALRAEDPVHWSQRHGGWLLTRYDDVLAAFGDPRLSSERIRGASEDPVVELLRDWMVFRDPPSHTRMRGPFRATFTPRLIQGLGARIERVVSDLLDGLADEDAVDLVSAFAFPLPAIVIAELLGVPAADRDRFHAWSVDLAALVMVGEAPDRRARAAHGVAGLAAYLRAHLDCLPPEFEAARAELSEDEIVATAVLLLFAGHETTTSLIANGVWTLLQHPAEVARLRADESLMPTAVDELLRYEGPTKAMPRRARDDLELRGRRRRG